MTISFIIPAYNEVKRLPLTLRKIESFLPALRAGFFVKEVIIVDDGSNDDLSKKINLGHLPIKLISYKTNRGKGYAVREGVKAAGGDLIFVYDADAAAPPAELNRLLSRLSGSDLVIGSRFSSSETKVKMSILRRLTGLAFHLLCWPLIPDIKDASCGAKLLKHGVAKGLFREQRLDRFAFDIEVLWLARRVGLKVAEVPINWTAVPGSKIRPVKDVIEMLGAVLSLYKRQLLS